MYEDLLEILRDLHPDIDFEKEPSQPVWESECMNTEVDMVEVVRCKDCKYAHLTYDGTCKYCDMLTDDDGYLIERYLPGNWFCADGERRNNDG